MEFLTLHDIPHRHFTPMDSRRMASPPEQRAHGQAGGSDAVCASWLHLPPTRRPTVASLSSPLPVSSPSPSSATEPPSTQPILPPQVLEPTPAFRDESLSRLGSRVDSVQIEVAKSNMSEQSRHILRNSPPFQPGEQNSSQYSLPSFHQLTQSIRKEPSPPQTPSRRDASMESSPVTKMPQFNEMQWQGQDGKRRRVDTMTATHRSSAVPEQISYDPHRSSIVDPQLSSAYGSPRSSTVHNPTMQQPTASHHHRPSLPLPVPPPPTSVMHARHRSSPVSQGHASYYHQHGHPSSGPSAIYPPPPTQHGATVEHGPGYSQGHRPIPHGHLWDRPLELYYPGPTYVSSGQSFNQELYQHTQQHNYTFHSNVGVDQSFIRKRRGNLPKEATGILKQWFNSHRESPYPTEDEKLQLCNQTSLTLNQVSNWFINARRRAPQKEQREHRENGAEEA